MQFPGFGILILDQLINLIVENSEGIRLHGIFHGQRDKGGFQELPIG
jgi:hypothetical protein